MSSVKPSEANSSTISASSFPIPVVKKTVKQLAFNLPATLLKPLTIIPNSVSELLIAFSLNQAFQSALHDQELDFLIKNWLQLTITDVNFRCFITVVENPSGEANMQVVSKLPNDKPKPDVECSADAYSLSLLANKQVDPDTLFFQRKLLVTGDTELGLAIKNFLDDFDIKDSLPEPIRNLISRF